jgi:hypothetical protein
MMRSRCALLLMIFVMLAGSGCIFEPREAEKPTGGDQYPWVTPNAAKDVFLNLKSGLAANVDSNYELSLDATFTFGPTDRDSINLGADKFANWTKAVEINWLKTVKTLYPGARTIQFGDQNGNFAYENVDTGRATFQGVYSMTLDRGDGSAKEVYAGTARFTIVRGSTGWALTVWRDISDNGTDPTSSYLRGSLRQ